MSIAGQITGMLKFTRDRFSERTTFLAIGFVSLAFFNHPIDITNLEQVTSNLILLLNIPLGMVGFFVKDESPISKIDK